jgi:hypothetical protein
MISYKEFIMEEYVDIRTDTSPRDVVQKAIDEIRTLGYKSPFDNSIVIDDNVLIEVSYFDGYLHLNSIMTIVKGKGDATRIMNKICEIADKYKVTIHLSPEPFGIGNKLNKTQLIKWYKKFGFVNGGWQGMKKKSKI